MIAAASGLFYASYVALWVLVTTLALIMIVLLRHFGLVTTGTLEGVQRDGLPVGGPAPAIVGVTAEGEPYASTVSPSASRFIVFGAPSCEPCGNVLPYLADLSVIAENELEVLVVVPGPAAAAEAMSHELRRAVPTQLHIIGDDGSGLSNEYRVRVTPFAFVISADGFVQAKGLCGDPVRLRDLLAVAGLDHVAKRMNDAAETYASERSSVPSMVDNQKVGVS